MKKVATIFLLLCSFSVCAVEQSVMSIKFLGARQDIKHIMQLQKNMPMSETPKELSVKPAAICFEANIDKFLPKDRKGNPTYGCIFSDQVAMNAALLRAGLFVHTDMGLASDDQMYNSKLMKAVGGHDFSGSQLMSYNNHMDIPSETKPEFIKYKAIEHEFNEQVLQPLLITNRGDFILFAVINTKKFKENLSHELLHAQYYDSPTIRPILLDVWQKVPKNDQDVIIDCLKNGGYDMKQEELLLREFYSYFLQYNAEQYLEGIPVLKPMAKLAPLYAPKIRAALTQQGIKVLYVQ